MLRRRLLQGGIRSSQGRPGAPVGTLLVVAALALAGCGYSVDAEQARVCRTALPALNPDGARLDVLRTAPGSEARTVRIDYRVERENRTPLDRWVLCRFAAEGLSPNKTELVGLQTERGAVSGSSLYLLRRFYIDSPEGLAGAPVVDRDAHLAEVPRPLAYALQQLLVGLPRTAIYGLLAGAYALVFGLVGRINLAFGELAAVGAAASVAGVALASAAVGGASPLAGLTGGLLCALFAGGLHGAVGGAFAIGRIPPGQDQASLIATVGLSLALMEYLRVAQSPVAVWLPPIWSEPFRLVRGGDFVVGVTPVSLLTGSLGLLAAGGLVVLMRASAFGRAWRAYADDAGAASLCGVDGPGLLRRTLALAGAMAGLAGLLVVVQFGGLGFAGGFQFGLKALVAAVLGGIGSVPGALLGGLAIGLFETLWSAFLPLDARDVALYCALVAVLIWKPGGFFGSRDPTPRPV